MFSSHVSHILFISVTNSSYNFFMTDFIRPFYSCMLKTVVSECRNHGCGCLCSQNPQCHLCAFEHYLHLKTEEKFQLNKVTFSLTSAQGQDTQHATVNYGLPLRVCTKKSTHFALLDSFNLFQKPYIIYVSRM